MKRLTNINVTNFNNRRTDRRVFLRHTELNKPLITIHKTLSRPVTSMQMSRSRLLKHDLQLMLRHQYRGIPPDVAFIVDECNCRQQGQTLRFMFVEFESGICLHHTHTHTHTEYIDFEAKLTSVVKF